MNTVCKQLTAVVVTDLTRHESGLATLLNKYCARINVIGQACSLESARELVRMYHPDLLLLRTRMPQEELSELLDATEEYEPLVVFMTADETPVNKARILDSLLALTTVNRLQSVMEMLEELQPEGTSIQELIASYQDSGAAVSSPASISTETSSQKIVLSTERGLLLEELRNIVRIQSENNYVTVVRNQLKDIVLSRSLRDFEAILDADQFVRVHNSHIINMKYLREYESRNGGCVILDDGSRIPVSRRRQSRLIEKIRQYKCV